jgi:hypothetical protein
MQLVPWLSALAADVLVQAFLDAQAGDVGARWWLEDDTPDLRFWCDVLSVRPRMIRRALHDPHWPERLSAARALLLAERGWRQAGVSRHPSSRSPK